LPRNLGGGERQKKNCIHFTASSESKIPNSRLLTCKILCRKERIWNSDCYELFKKYRERPSTKKGEHGHLVCRCFVRAKMKKKVPIYLKRVWGARGGKGGKDASLKQKKGNLRKCRGIKGNQKIRERNEYGRTVERKNVK